MFRFRDLLLVCALVALLVTVRADQPTADCSIGTVLTTSGVCVAVHYIEGCFSYESFNRCASCEFNYDLKDGQCDYNPKAPGQCCLQFDSKGECSQCETGLFLKDGACEQATIVGCLQKVQGKCLNCANGYYISSDICRQGTKGCSAYNADGLCTGCRDGFKFIDGRCSKRVIPGCAQQKNSVCSKCFEPFVLNGGACTIANCASSNDFGCLECQDGYYLKDGACQSHIKGCQYYQRGKCGACTEDYEPLNDGCISQGCSNHNDQYECLECASPFELKNKKCAISNCLRHHKGKCASCQPSYNLKKGLCVQAANYTNFVGEVCQVCAPNFYINSQSKCTPYDIGCTAYTNGQCTNCVAPFQIQTDGSCVIDGCDTATNSGCTVCKSIYQLNENVCKLPNCERARQGICQRCSKGYVAKSGVCYTIDPNCAQYADDGQCSSCNDGYHPDSQGTCQKNLVGCIYTSGSCTSCITPFTLSDSGACTIDGCEEYNAKGCNRCPKGMYLTAGICKQRQPGCKYDASGNCATCSDKFTYQSGTCVIEGCSQYTLEACSACTQPYELGNGVCTIPNCAQTSNGKCTQCNNGYLTNTAGGCQRSIDNCNDYDGDSCQTCNGGFYLSATKDKCLQVSPGCIYRSGACADCSDGYLFDGGVCWKVDPNCIAQSKDHKCTQCKDTFYLDTNGVCQQGDLQCDEFKPTNDGKCNRCKALYYVNKLKGCSRNLPGCQYKQGKCIGCNAPFSFQNGTCEISGCLTYSDQGCTSCAAPYSVVNFTCQGSANDGVSQRTPKGCKTYQSGKCIECLPKYFLWMNICFPFAEGCLQYTGKSCVQCSPDYKLAQGICVKKMKDWSFGNDIFNKRTEVFNVTTGSAPTAVQSKQYASGSAIGKLIYSSLYNFTYLNYQIVDTINVTGGWRSKNNASGEWVGLSVSSPQTFYQVVIQQGDSGSYFTEFTVEFKLKDDDWKVIPQKFTSKECGSGKVLTFDFTTPVEATQIRMRVKSFVQWPSCRFDFIYNNVDERNDWQGIRNIAEIDKKIAGIMGSRLDNQLDINIRSFFVPTRDCANKEQCWSGAEFCEPKKVTGFSMGKNDNNNNTITAAFVDYSLDGLLFVCYKSCNPLTLAGLKSIVFDQPLKAKYIRVHPTKWTGDPQVTFSFDYS